MLCDEALLSSHPTAMVCTCAVLESARALILAKEIYTIPSTIKNGIKLALLTINAIQYHHHYHHQHNHFPPPFWSFISLFQMLLFQSTISSLLSLSLSLSLPALKYHYFNKLVHWYHLRLAKTSLIQICNYGPGKHYYSWSQRYIIIFCVILNRYHIKKI